MKRVRPTIALLMTMLATVSRETAAASEESLLPPFPEEAHVAPEARASAVPVRPETVLAESLSADVEQAAQLADSLAKRNAARGGSGVPVRGIAVPLRAASATRLLAGMNLVAQATAVPSLFPAGDAPADAMLPPLAESAASEFIGGDAPGETSPDASPLDVPREELAPAPTYGDVGAQTRQGPVFRVSGGEAFEWTRRLGYRFTPAGGMGRRDGMHTAAAQFANLITSEVHGTRMAQYRPPLTWNVQETSNTFFMFCDASFRAVRLNAGWRIRGIRLQGPNWEWVACPRSGASTASFSVRLHAARTGPRATVVELASLTLEGPPGAADWREAFPSLNGQPALVPGRRKPAGAMPEAAPAAPAGEDTVTPEPPVLASAGDE